MAFGVARVLVWSGALIVWVGAASCWFGGHEALTRMAMGASDGVSGGYQ